jgi:hypothetical protein
LFQQAQDISIIASKGEIDGDMFHHAEQDTEERDGVGHG